MAKLPTIEDLGAAPQVSGQMPVASYDLTPWARGAAALAEGGEKLGAGIVKLGAGMTEYEVDKARYQYHEAMSQFGAGEFAHRNGLQNRQDYQNLPGDYQNGYVDAQGNQQPGIQQRMDDAAKRIDSAPMRERFTNDAQRHIVLPGAAKVDEKARGLEGSTRDRYVAEAGNDASNQYVATQDPNERTGIMSRYRNLVESHAAAGWMRQDQVPGVLQRWGHQILAADVQAAINSGDPTRIQNAYNALTTAPGGREDIKNRIREVEGFKQNPMSSAYGYGQFIEQTWLDQVKRHGAEHDLGNLADQIERRPDGKYYVADPQAKRTIMALRGSYDVSDKMLGHLLDENADVLKSRGVDQTPGNLYLAHMLGAGTAANLAQARPGTPIEQILSPAAIAANRRVLAGHTAGEVMQWADGKMGGTGPGQGHVYDFLPVDQRENLKAHLLAAMHKNTVNDGAQFKAGVADHLAEADRTGAVQKPYAIEDFVSRYGPEDGPKQFNEYQKNIQHGADKFSIAQMTPDQINDLRQERTPMPATEPGHEGEYTADAKRLADLERTIKTVQDAKAKDPQFQARVKSEIEEMRTTGTVANPIPESEFHDRLDGQGAGIGAEAYRQHQIWLKLGHDVRAENLGKMEPKEIGQLLQSYKPQPGPEFLAQSQRQAALAQAADEVKKERDADPAAFAIKYRSAAGEAYQALLSRLNQKDADPDTVKNFARDYAIKTLAEQANAGVAPMDRRVLPQRYIDDLNSRLQPPTSGGAWNVVQTIRSEANLWGKQWPDVMQQLGDKVNPVVRVIGDDNGHMDPDAARRLVDLRDLKAGDILKDESPTKLSALQDEVRKATSKLFGSLAGQDGGVMLGHVYEGQILKLAASYVAQDSKPTDQAAEMAFKNIVGNRYEWRDTYRIPKTAPVSANDAEAGAHYIRDKLRWQDIAASGDATEQTENRLWKLKRDLKWTTSPKEDGLMLLYGNQFIRRPDGSPFIVSWQDLADAGGKAYRARAALRFPEEGIGPPVPGPETP